MGLYEARLRKTHNEKASFHTQRRLLLPLLFSPLQSKLLAIRAKRHYRTLEKQRWVWLNGCRTPPAAYFSQKCENIVIVKVLQRFAPCVKLRSSPHWPCCTKAEGTALTLTKTFCGPYFTDPKVVIQLAQRCWVDFCQLNAAVVMWQQGNAAGRASQWNTKIMQLKSRT